MRTNGTSVEVTPLEQRASWARQETVYDAGPRTNAERASSMPDPLVTVKVNIPTSLRDQWQSAATERGVELDDLVESAMRSLLGAPVVVRRG